MATNIKTGKIMKTIKKVENLSGYELVAIAFRCLNELNKHDRCLSLGEKLSVKRALQEVESAITEMQSNLLYDSSPLKKQFEAALNCIE